MLFWNIACPTTLGLSSLTNTPLEQRITAPFVIVNGITKPRNASCTAFDVEVNRIMLDGSVYGIE